MGPEQSDFTIYTCEFHCAFTALSCKSHNIKASVITPSFDVPWKSFLLVNSRQIRSHGHDPKLDGSPHVLSHKKKTPILGLLLSQWVAFDFLVS